MDERTGQKVVCVILNQFLSEMLSDIKVGNGQSTFSKLFRLNQVDTGETPKICTKCHHIQAYKSDTYNACKSCGYNPTVYSECDSSSFKNNPYMRFGIMSGDFKPVKSYEQEPLALNPSSYESLVKMLEKLDSDRISKMDECSAIGLDGLPGVRGVALLVQIFS